MRQTDVAQVRPVSVRSHDWTKPGHLRLRLLLFVLYAVVYWAIIIAVLVHFHSSPLLIEGFNQHIVSAPSTFTVGTLKFIVTIISSILTVGLAYTAKSVLEIDLALRLQSGLSAIKLNRSWSALTGSLTELPSRYTLVLINAVIGAAVLSSQFGVYMTESSERVALNVTGAELDQLNIDGEVLPYYRGDSPALSWFYNSMTISTLKTYNAKLDIVESFGRLDKIHNSLARPADKFSDGNRGVWIYQHQTAFGAPYDVASYAPFYGDMPENDSVSVCAQTFKQDSISCKWYTTENGAVSNLEIATSRDGAMFNLNDEDLVGYSNLSVKIDEPASAAIKELDSGDFVVIFASVYDSDWLSLVRMGPFPTYRTSKLASGRCLVKKEPFRFSPVSWKRIGDTDVALTASYDTDTRTCSDVNANPNTLLPHTNATSAGMVLAEHVAALLVPPEQNGRGLGWLLTSRLKSTLYGAYEIEDILGYVVRGLVSAGMVSPTGRTDTMSMSSYVDAISYHKSFGVQGDAWVLVLLVLPALSTIIALFFAAKLLFGKRPAMKPENLFEVTKLILAPRTNSCVENGGSLDEKDLMMKWNPDQASIDCYANSDASVI